MTEEEAKKFKEVVDKTTAAQFGEAEKAINNFGKELGKVLDPVAKAMSGVAAQVAHHMSKLYEGIPLNAIDQWRNSTKKERDKKKPNPFKDEREI